jgi:hypothetical protein
MAINPSDLPLLIDVAKASPFHGSLLTLGRQEVLITNRALQKVAKILSFELADVGTAAGDGGDQGREAMLSDTELFRSLGFSEVHSMDYSDYENATILHDLNRVDPPEELLERFDVVLDRGTSQHVFHTPNLLSSLVRMTKFGGRIIHFSPSSNHIDLGFYMYSPTLFYDYYTANGLEINRIYLVRQPWLERYPRTDVFAYTPGCLRAISHGGLDDGGYQIFCVVTRKPDSTFDRIPQQSFYVAKWRQAAAADIEALPPAEGGALEGLKSLVRRNPLLHRFVTSIVNPIKKRRWRRRSLRRIARYSAETW